MLKEKRNKFEVIHEDDCSGKHMRINSPSKDYMEGKVSLGYCINCGVEAHYPNSTDGDTHWHRSESYEKMLASRRSGSLKGAQGKIRNRKAS